MDEGWNPEPEQRVDAAWLEAENERLRRQAEDFERAAAARALAAEQEINGARRADDGRFAVHRERVCRTDGNSTLSVGEFEEIILRVQHQMRKYDGVSPMLALAAAKAMRRLYEEFEYEAVAIARDHGWSWSAIGEVLGISESGAHRRYGGSLVPGRRRRRGGGGAKRSSGRRPLGGR